MNLLSLLGGLLTGKAGASIGGAVSNVAQWAAALAAVAPLALWLTGNKDEVFITLTYGDLAFWGLIAAAQIVVIRLVRYAPPPAG